MHGEWQLKTFKGSGKLTSYIEISRFEDGFDSAFIAIADANM